MNKNIYHGWIIVEDGKPFKDYISVEYTADGVRHSQQMESRGQTGAAEAVEWWEKRLGQQIKLEPTLKGMYRVYTEAK